MRQLTAQALAFGVVFAPSATGSLGIEPAWDLGSLGTGASAPRWSPALPPSSAAELHSAHALAERIEAAKRVSGLTWNQLAGALGVRARTLHLWRRGGGIRHEQERRLRAFFALITGLVDHAGEGAREELLKHQGESSLLSRLEAGEEPDPLRQAAPWRAQAREDLSSNVARLDTEEPLAEDYAFLFRLDDDQVAEFTRDALSRLEDSSSGRAQWEQLLEDRAWASAFHHLALEDTPVDDDDLEPPPLFRLEDLHLSMRPGGIAARGDRR